MSTPSSPHWAIPQPRPSAPAVDPDVFCGLVRPSAPLPYAPRVEVPDVPREGKVFDQHHREPAPYDKPMARWPLALCVVAIAAPLMIWAEVWIRPMLAPVSPAPVVAVAEPAAAPAVEAPSAPPLVADKRVAPLTTKLLLERTDALAKELKLKPSTTYTARVGLRRIRRELEATPDAAALQSASDELDAWEQRYLRARRTEVLEAAR